MRPYRENCYLQVLSNIVGQNFYLRLLASCKGFFKITYKHWQGRQLCAKTFWTHSEILLESLNFVDIMRPNKHKMRLEDFSTTWPNLFGILLRQSENLASFAKYFRKSFYAMWSYRYLNPNTRHPARPQAPLHFPYVVNRAQKRH